MYQPTELADFALAEFARGLANLTDEEGRTRLTKADGTEMNAISWIVGHVSWQWIFRALRAGMARGLTESEARAFCDLRPRVNRFASGSDAATPPPLEEALQLFHDARSLTRWVEDADSALLTTMVEADSAATGPQQELREWLIAATIKGENLGTALMRSVLHTWFHIGEINAIRQLQGYPEISFVGPLVGNLEWRPAASSARAATGMYLPHELASFALHSLGRDLDGLGEQDARARLKKADGSEMNAISWTVAHLGRHWLRIGSAAMGGPGPTEMESFATGSTDATPPSQTDALVVLDAARGRLEWIAGADEALLGRPGGAQTLIDESVGTRLIRVVLHTWFHIGEINGIRQMLGHPEIAFVGPMVGRLEWRSVQDIPRRA